LKTIGSPRPWPPEACDELRQHFERYSWAHQRGHVVDDLHDLLEELDEWLADDRSYVDRARKDEWQSLIDDIDAVWAVVGPALAAEMPTVSLVRDQLHSKLGRDQTARAGLRPVLDQVRAEARKPEAAAAAFDALVQAIQDPTTRSEVITGRVDVLDSVLRFANQGLADVVGTLNGILNNDTWYVAVAHHLLDGDALPDEPIAQEDEDAGLREADRLALARRWVAYVPSPAHLVVWVFYGSARLDRWRVSVGSCEFVSGSALLGALAEFDEVRGRGEEYPGDRSPFSTLPTELQGEEGWAGFARDPKEWPKEENWVAVRVDLGVGAFTNIEQTARDQAEAIVALAAFEQDGTTWSPLTGYKSFRDGNPGRYSVPFRDRATERRWIEADHTHEWLYRNAGQLGAHVLNDPDAHDVITSASALNAGNNASPMVQILEAVRSVETQSTVLKVDWRELIKTHVVPWHALETAKTAAYNAIGNLSGRYELYAQLPDLHKAADGLIESTGDGLYRFKVGEAFTRLPGLAAQMPTYHVSARRIRELLVDLATPTSAAAYIQRLRETDERLVNRAGRVRNSLTHGGPINAGIVRTTAEFLGPKAKTLAGTTIRALLDGKPVADGPDELRTSVDAVMARFSTSAKAFEALYGKK